MGIIALVMVLMIGVAGMGMGIGAHTAAANAADAAALAAAPVTFMPFGAKGGPAREAARFASLNGARLVRCTCPVDQSWNSRTVEVVVVVAVPIPGLGHVNIRASARATFEPIRLIASGMVHAPSAATTRSRPSVRSTVDTDA